MIKQKLYGIASVALGLLVPFVDGDATASLILIPCGIFLVFTKGDWIL